MTTAPAVDRLLGEIGSALLVVLAIWLGWQVVREMAAERTPVAMAIRLSPHSPSVLARAAEAELAAKRPGNAAELAQDSLTRAPFNARALRVMGLAIAETGDLDIGEQLIIQAGNWSLRDNQAHAWLVERLLRKGDYRSSFAHADALARRRRELWDQIFGLYQVSAATDPRAFPALVSLMESMPPWRQEFLTHLSRSPVGLGVSANLAVALQRTRAPYSTAELGQLYVKLRERRAHAGIALVRKALDRPSVATTVVDGSFPAKPSQTPAPFQWEFPAASGVVAEVLQDEIRPDETALRAQYDGFAVNKFADQFIQLPPGSYSLTGEARAEAGKVQGRFAWRVICAESDVIIAESRSVAWPTDRWTVFQTRFVIPPANCTGQWLRLEPLPADQRKTVVAWFDRLQIHNLAKQRSRSENG